MSESALQKKIITYLDGIGAYTIKTIATNKRGCPDILFCINGMFCAVEVKAPGKMSTVTKLQQHNLDRINASGGIAIAADNLNIVIDTFKRLTIV